MPELRGKKQGKGRVSTTRPQMREMRTAFNTAGKDISSTGISYAGLF